jgi:hypothetical protein
MQGMRDAKERKRLELASGSREVGRIVFSGSMFETVHVIRCLDAGNGDPKLLIEIDGQAVQPKSVKGLIRSIGQRLWR